MKARRQDGHVKPQSENKQKTLRTYPEPRIESFAISTERGVLLSVQKSPHISDGDDRREDKE